jgi:translocation protein SEC63
LEKRLEAEKRFVEINKAYKALTDEKMRKNWEEYGNPDGIRTFALGVALPSWLVKSSNRILLLALYCLAFGIGLPLIVRRWWTSSKDFTKDGLRHASMAMFFKELKENSGLKRIMELIVASQEFALDLPKRAGDKAAVEKLFKELKEYKNPYGDTFDVARIPKGLTDEQNKAYTLLYCHFHRFPITDEALRTDQQYCVSKGLQLVNGMLQIAMARNWLVPVLNCMSFSQYLVQGMWEGQSSLLQLPHITNEIARHAISGKKSIKTVADLLDMSEGDRRSLLRTLTDDQYKEVIEVAQTFPLVTVPAVNCRILGQEHITPGGLISCQAVLELEYPSVDHGEAITASTASDSGNEQGQESSAKSALDEDVQTFEFDEDGNLIDDPATSKGIAKQNSVPRPVYAPHFPNVKRPCWWVALINKNHTNLISQPIKVHDLADRKTVVIQLPAPPKAMNVLIKLVIKSDSTVGADIEKDVSFVVHPPAMEKSPVESWDISGEEDEQTVPFADSDESGDE